MISIKHIRWRVEYLGYLALEYLLSQFSLQKIYKLGALLGSLVYRFSTKYRGIVQRNLAMTMGRDALVTPSDEDIKKVFSRNGGNLLTTLSAGKQEIKELDDHLEITGLEELDAQLEHSGALLVLAHMGNWEILSKLTDCLKNKNPIGSLYRPLNNPYMNELILTRRKASGMTLISSRNPAFKIIKHLKKKGLMCILSDQRIGKKGSLSSFFGRVTPCTRLALTLHEKVEVPIFVLSMRTVEAGKWKLEIKRVMSPSQQSIMDTLAEGMEKSLADCFWFQDRWQEFPVKSLVEGEAEIQSAVFKRKPLSGIVESRQILNANPKIKQLLKAETYPLTFWDEGANPASAYFAIGTSKEFQKACHKVGLKKACLTPKRAMRVLTR